MTITQDNYLNLGHLLVNELFGGATLLILVGWALITYYGVKNNAPFQVQIMLVLAWAGAVLSFAYNALIWMVGLLFLALIIYASFPKLFRE